MKHGTSDTSYYILGVKQYHYYNRCQNNASEDRTHTRSYIVLTHDF